MISKIIDILAVDDFYGETRKIDIAKGRYDLPTTWKSTKLLLKRIWFGRKLGNK